MPAFKATQVVILHYDIDRVTQATNKHNLEEVIE